MLELNLIFLPATSDAVAHYAETLTINTLRQQRTAIAQWHLNQGIPDLTKAPLIKKVLRGIHASGR